ncbi:MAG: ATP-binding cassette domain-containing protein [Eubacteriales bacterium]|nr:ATP-binding cassette domain-containing protein [Eubacteriales bacterium]
MLLEMRNISKVFPGVRALDNVNICVAENSIHAICGENGAGKSTLMKVLSGIHPFGTYEGDIVYQGETCKFKNIKDSEKKGIVIIHQELALVPELSIAENMFLGNERANMHIINWDETKQECMRYMALVGLEESPDTLIKDISVGKQQLVEIAKALSKDVKLLILDEPTSSLNDKNAKALLDLLISLKNEKNISSIIISHKLNEITYVADKTTIIRDGKSIETLDHKTDDMSEDRIIKSMVGRELSNRYPKRNVSIGEECFRVENWTVYHPEYNDKKIVDNACFTLKRGEIIGIAGLIGAGRTELAMSLFGKAYGTNISGKMYKDGKEVHFNTVSQAIDGGMAYVTEDRKGNGLIVSQSIKRNISIAKPSRVSRNYVYDKDLETKLSLEFIKNFRVKANNEKVNVENLSGGNQQKVLLAKWVFTQPDILILDEPTRGVDVGAKYEIYEIMNQLVAQGKSIIMISSELPEILGVSDRVYVMHEGKILAEMPTGEASQEIIMGHIIKYKGAM